MMPSLKTSTVYLTADSEEKSRIRVVVYPCIAAKLHTHNVLNKNLSYLQYLKLAHSYDESTFAVLLLIGVDHYLNIIGNGIIRGPGPVDVTSKIGYLLPGPTCSSMKHTHFASYKILSYHRN